MKTIANNRADLGVAINLHVLRHYKSRTYGTPVDSAVAKKLRDVAASPDPKKSDTKKRSEVIDIVRLELAADIKEVKVLITPKAAIWMDLDDAFKKDTSKSAARDKEALRDEIVDRIKAGEKEVAAQDLDRWSA